METDPTPEDVKQRTDEWKKLDPQALAYHSGQWDSAKQSTFAFAEFARERLEGARGVLDLAAGGGAATAQLAQRFPGVRFTGLDFSGELVALANRLSQDRKIENLRFVHGDWYRLEPSTAFDGVISLQTLSWLPDYEAPLVEIFRKLKPAWIALTSLFYEGDITCRIEAEEHQRGRKSFYNVYSIPAIARLCEANGYRLARAEPFRIGIDIARPADLDSMGTYTRRVVGESGGIERLQISGPVLMSWHMLMIERS